MNAEQLQVLKNELGHALSGNLTPLTMAGPMLCVAAAILVLAGTIETQMKENRKQ